MYVVESFMNKRLSNPPVPLRKTTHLRDLHSLEDPCWTLEKTTSLVPTLGRIQTTNPRKKVFRLLRVPPQVTSVGRYRFQY